MINKDEDLGAYLNWKIGNKTLTTLSDGYNPIDYDTVHSIPKEVGIYLQREAHRTDNPIFTHNMFLIRGDDHPPILIDAGMGGSAGPTLGWLTSSLAKAGVKKEEIGLILMTHLHPDHCGGLVDENGEAVFPNATLVVHEDEIDFWLTLEGEQRSPESLKPFFEMVRASVKPYLERLVKITSGEVAPGITAVPLVGHTPGHTGYVVESEGVEVFIWADIVHLPAIQPAWPSAGVIHDVDPDLAAATRKKVFVELADRKQLVAGNHLEFPGLAYLERKGEAFKLVPQLWISKL